MAATDLRATFDEDPGLYHRARPGYPAELLDHLGEVAGIGPGARVVEVGPGTGQATAALLARGASVTAVELGAGLARALEERFAGAPLQVVVSAFEDWVPPPEPFDALVAFTSWHWLDPAVRVPRAAAVLRPGGVLATVGTTHVAGRSDDFFADVQECYQRWDRPTLPGLRLPRLEDVPPLADEVDDSPLFEAPAHHRCTRDVACSTSAYLDLLATYSENRALAPSQREGLLGCIGARMDEHYGGSVTLRYLHRLRTARLRAPAPR
jgi:SAM-dependent methyltransferase